MQGLDTLQVKTPSKKRRVWAAGKPRGLCKYVKPSKLWWSPILSGAIQALLPWKQTETNVKPRYKRQKQFAWYYAASKSFQSRFWNVLVLAVHDMFCMLGSGKHIGSLVSIVGDSYGILSYDCFWSKTLEGLLLSFFGFFGQPFIFLIGALRMYAWEHMLGKTTRTTRKGIESEDAPWQ